MRTLFAVLFSLSLVCGCSGSADEDPTGAVSEEPEGADVAADIEMPAE
jgi:hypothetical protein